MECVALSGRGVGQRVVSVRFMRRMMLVAVAATTVLLHSAALASAEPTSPAPSPSPLPPPVSSRVPSSLPSADSTPRNNCTCPPPPKLTPCSHNHTVTTVSSTPARHHASHRRHVKREDTSPPDNSTISSLGSSPTSSPANCSSSSAGQNPNSSSSSSGNSSKCGSGVQHVSETSAKGDPHLVGRHGEKFEFHGQDGASYCLVTDRTVQINMHLFAGAKKGSTYIDEIGVVTRSGIRIVVSAQSAADVSPQGVQGQLEVNSASLPDDILTIDLLRHTVRIDRRKTSVRVRVRGVVDLTVDILPDFSRQSRPNYLNIRIRSLHASRKVHGIIGQTYQDSAVRLDRFNESQSKNGPAKERAIIDGNEDDYRTSGVLKADCKFQQFGKKPASHSH
ncbi:hypothetical protein CLOM_g23664 [Closterium sp. NIES-68]|nr:hypothetical protein CLOM_g23664 [Closterium sp. NIES-68]GJP86884.1 hypothetical protein CLOP_g16857 [Closterium sp. NIES-67]